MKNHNKKSINNVYVSKECYIELKIRSMREDVPLYTYVTEVLEKEVSKSIKKKKVDDNDTNEVVNE